MSAAIQTSVLDTLKSAQDPTTGNLNVNAVVSAPSVQTVSGTVVVSTITNPVTIGTLPALVAGTAVIGHVIVDSGSVTATINGTVPVTATINGTVPVSGTFYQVTQPVKEIVTSTSSIATVNASVTSTQLLAANANRLNALLFNNSNSNLYIALSTSATSTAFTVLVPANGYYELPAIRMWIGAITGTWASATGSVQVTELS